MSDITAQQALELWGLEAASLTLIAQRENIVYRVDEPNTQRSWALRLHRVGLRNKLELISESQWMQALSKTGMNIPAPVESKNGHLCEEINGQWVDLQVWMAGDTLSHHLTNKHYYNLGSAMAQLHNVSDAWAEPTGFQRPAWNRDGLLGDSPMWGRFWENTSLAEPQRLLLNRFRIAASNALLNQQANLDYGLIHADLVTDNVLVENQQLHLIDFDDSGYGYRLFDVATVVLRAQRETQHEALTNALIEGYLSVRTLDLSALELFLALRACTYIGWIAPRMGEQASSERCARFIKIGCAQVESWLKTCTLT